MTLALPAMAATETVDLAPDNKFVPASLTVSVGDTVQFNWTGGFHDVTFSDGEKSGAPTADTGALYSRTFNSPGTYNYVCTVHEALGMKGTITASAAAGETTTTTAETTTTTAGSGNTTTTADVRQMPSTGPEDSMVPVLGAVLVAIGAGGLLMVRRNRA
jgi:LPXTG-motif cell wall-anchored protein